MGVEILDNGTRVLTAPGAMFGTDALLLGGLPSPAGRAGAGPVQRVRHCGAAVHDAGHRDHARRWNLTRRQAHSAARRLRRTALSISRRSARIYGSSARKGRSRGSMILQPQPALLCGGAAPPDKRRAEARHTDSCTTADAVDCARRALRDGDGSCCASGPSSWPRY